MVKEKTLERLEELIEMNKRLMEENRNKYNLSKILDSARQQNRQADKYLMYREKANNCKKIYDLFTEYEIIRLNEGESVRGVISDIVIDSKNKKLYYTDNLLDKDIATIVLNEIGVACCKRYYDLYTYGRIHFEEGLDDKLSEGINLIYDERRIKEEIRETVVKFNGLLGSYDYLESRRDIFGTRYSDILKYVNGENVEIENIEIDKFLMYYNEDIYRGSEVYKIQMYTYNYELGGQIYRGYERDIN